MKQLLPPGEVTSNGKIDYHNNRFIHLILAEKFSIKSLIANSPALLSNCIESDDHWEFSKTGLLNIYGNLSEEDIARILSHDFPIKAIQFGRKFDVTKLTLQLINEKILPGRPELAMNDTFNHCGPFDDLAFLEFLPNLQSYSFFTFSQIDISPISRFLKLKRLGLGGYNISLKPLEGYESLEIFNFGEKIKDLGTISAIPNISQMTINSQNLRSLAFLIPLQKLFKLTFSGGGTTSFENLKDLKSLEHLAICFTRKLEIEHLLPINEILKLKMLHLWQLPRITDFSWIQNKSLKELIIDDLKGVETYESVGHLSLDKLIIKDRLDDKKISSLAALEHVKEIKIWQHYLEKSAEKFKSLPNYNRIVGI